jgi:hypothetical protein
MIHTNIYAKIKDERKPGMINLPNSNYIPSGILSNTQLTNSVTRLKQQDS